MIRATTIVDPLNTVLIRVLTHSAYDGRKFTEPNWQIMGTVAQIQFEWRWEKNKDLVLGDLGRGEYILDVADLGLDHGLCIAFMNDTREICRLQEEEDEYSLHSDPDGECHCAKIADIHEHRHSLFHAIEDAVKEHFDAWTRRRHLVALALDAGMLSTPAPLLDTGLPAPPEPAECQSPVLPIAGAVAPDWSR